ncbi:MULTISPECIES: serine/threonine-protein kinase [Nocardioides]|nr:MULTISPECIES: serine/threonine-protein kinase [unclassified Nocardioides]
MGALTTLVGTGEGTTVIGGRYTLEQEIGRGGMGAVWLARDEVLGRSVALKRVGFGPGGGEPDLDRAEREARLAARLNHPHVVAVFDLLVDGDDRWLVMEHVPGVTLAELVRRDGPLSPDQAATLLRQAADALAAAHGAGIVHRDVKPSNILVGPDGQVKISDFGIARAQADASLTQTGLVTGSPAYLAPEVASGQVASQASDVWSLGATLFHALAGHPPYEVGDNVLGALYRIVNEDPPRLGAAAGWLAPVLDATMCQEPEQRWSMTQVRDVLAGGAAAPVPVVAPATRPVPAPEPTRAIAVPPVTPRRRPGLLLPALLVAGIAVAVLLAVWWAGLDDGTPEQADGGRSAAPDPSASSSAPAPEPAKTAEGMTTFIEDYLSTVTSDPKAAWTQLTPAFQAASGNFGQYQRFWRTIDSAHVVSSEADPDNGTVTYRVEYERADGSTASDEVTLRLEGRDGDYLIAGES